MNEIPIKPLQQTLAANNNVAFAYVFGSSVGLGNRASGSDLDIAVLLYDDPDPEGVYRIIKDLERVLGEDVLDLLVLNTCEDFILRNEVLKGNLIYCRDMDIHAAFFSWTLRIYEDENLRIKRLKNQ